MLCVAAAAFSLTSCADASRQKHDIHPFVQKLMTDTSCVEYKILQGYSEKDRMGSIAIVGEYLEAIRLADFFAVSDDFDNIDASFRADGIPDFAGERFEVLLDDANKPYKGYVDAGNNLFLRELMIRNAVSMLDSTCYGNAYDAVSSDAKNPAKALVFSSVSYSPEIIADMDTLLKSKGINIPVMYLPVSSVRHVFDSIKDISSVGVIADLDVAASGVYGELFRNFSMKSGYLAPVRNVIFSPEGDGPADKLKEFIRMYADAGYREPLDAIIIDDVLLASGIDTMYSALREMISANSEEGALYASVIAPDFRFIDPAKCVADDLFRELRSDNSMALRIAYPQFEFFLTVFSPEFMMQNGSSDVSDKIKYGRAYDSGDNTVKMVRLSRRHVGKDEMAVLDSLAPNIKINF